MISRQSPFEKVTQLAIREGHDLIVNGGCFTCFIDFFVASSDTSITNIIHDRVVEEHRVLRYNTNLFTETRLQVSSVQVLHGIFLSLPFEANVTNILRINRDASGFDIVESVNELQNSRFAATGLANESNSLSWRNFKADILQGRLALVICEGNTVKFDEAFAKFERFRIRHVSNGWLCLKKLQQALGIHETVRDLSVHGTEEYQRTCND